MEYDFESTSQLSQVKGGDFSRNSTYFVFGVFLGGRGLKIVTKIFNVVPRDSNHPPPRLETKFRPGGSIQHC